MKNNRVVILPVLIFLIQGISATAPADGALRLPPIDFREERPLIRAPVSLEKAAAFPDNFVFPYAFEMEQGLKMFIQFGLLQEFSVVDADTSAGKYRIDAAPRIWTLGLGYGDRVTFSFSRTDMDITAVTPSATINDSIWLNVFSAGYQAAAPGDSQRLIGYSLFDAEQTDYHSGSVSLRRNFGRLRAQAGLEVTGGGGVTSGAGAILIARYALHDDVVAFGEYHGRDPFKNVFNFLVPGSLTSAGFLPCKSCGAESVSFGAHYLAAENLTLKFAFHDAADLAAPSAAVYYSLGK